MPINTAIEVGDILALRRLERFGGLKLRDELTMLFLQEAPVRIAAARSALAQGDVEGVRAAAHMLKSSSGQMGALRMQHGCEQLERPDFTSDLGLALTDLDEELSRYTEWLKHASPPQPLP